MADTLTLDKVAIFLKDQEVLNITATIQPGQVLTVMGPSGSGKSTLLNYVLGNLDPVFQATGRVILGDKELTDLPNHLRKVGVLFQDDLLFPHLSVGANLAFGLTARTPRSERRSHIDEALMSVGLEGYYDRDPATLSGGQKSRVALMRTLLSEPKALLLDEPFSRLDTARRGQIRDLVFDHAKAQRLPVLLVTHDHEDAAAAGGELFTMGT